MRIAIMLAVLAFIVMPQANAAPINNSTEPVQEVQVQPEQVNEPLPIVQEPVSETPKLVEPERKPEVKPVKVEPKVQISTNKQELMQQAGIPEDEWAAVDYIISHESSWQYTAKNKSSGAYGLCQSLPASKMASAGEDYMSNPVTQLRWCSSYAVERYESWWSAYNFWRANKWW